MRSSYMDEEGPEEAGPPSGQASIGISSFRTVHRDSSLSHSYCCCPAAQVTCARDICSQT